LTRSTPPMAGQFLLLLDSSWPTPI